MDHRDHVGWSAERLRIASPLAESVSYKIRRLESDSRPTDITASQSLSSEKRTALQAKTVQFRGHYRVNRPDT